MAKDHLTQILVKDPCGSGRAHRIDHQLHMIGAGIGGDAMAEVEDVGIIRFSLPIRSFER